MIRKFIYLFLCITTILVGCTDGDYTQNKQIGVLYTDANKPDSTFLTFNYKGEITSETEIPAMGIFQVSEGRKGNLLFPVQFDQQLFTLSANGELTESTVLPFPLFVKESAKTRVTTFNSSVDSGTIEWNEATKTRRVTINGFPRVATFDQKYIYVFASIIQQKKAVIYVVTKTTGKVAKVIPLSIDQANDLNIIDQHLWITSISNEKRIGKINLTTWKVDYIPVPKSQTEYILPTTKELLVTHQGSNSITVLDRNTSQLKKQVTIPQPVFKAKLKGNFLYVLSQIPNTGQGVVGVYQISNWNLTKKLMLPAIRDTLVQDFTIF